MSEKTRTRPATTVERSEVIRASLAIEALPDLPPVMQVAMATDFVPWRDIYQAAHTAYARAKVKEGNAIDAAKEANEAFEVAMRKWMSGVTDTKGRHLPRSVAALIGGVLPSELSRKPDVEQVSLTSELREQLALSTKVRGEDDARETMLAARDALAAAVDARSDAEDVRAKAHKARARAAVNFDFGWGDVVRKITHHAPDLVERIPLFDAVPASDEDEGESTAAKGTTDEDEAEAEAEADEAKAGEAKAGEAGEAKAAEDEAAGEGEAAAK
jgi:hypothetical protein